MTAPDAAGVSLATLLAPLADMLGPVPGGATGETRVTAVEICDFDSPPSETGVLLLAAGTTVGTLEAEQALRFAHSSGAAGIVLAPGSEGHTQWSHDPDGPAVLLRSRWASWSELFVQLRRGLSGHRTAEGAPAAGYHSLSHLANTLATMTGAAITIEDLDSRVLAFSTVAGPVDQLRQETILGQRVPQWRVEELRRSGFLRELWSSTDVIHRPADGERPTRLVVAVRSDEEVFGSIWAAECETSFTPATQEALRLAAQVAIPLFIEAARTGGVRDRARQAAVHALLTGEGSATDAARVLDLPLGQGSRVLGFRAGDDTDPRHEGALLLRVLAEFPGSVSLTHEGTLWVLAPADLEESEQVLRARLRLAVTGVARPDTVLDVALGPAVHHLTEARASAHEVRQVLRALEARPAAEVGTVRLTALAEVQDEVSVQQVLELIRDHPAPYTRRLSVLLEYDREHGATLTQTLAVYLSTHGSIAETARRMHLHSNSLRYRLQRLSELSGIDLGDPHARLVTELGLRLLGISGDVPSPSPAS